MPKKWHTKIMLFIQFYTLLFKNCQIDVETTDKFRSEHANKFTLFNILVKFGLTKTKTFRITIRCVVRGWHSVINHCDRRITLLSDADISFGLFNLFTFFDLYSFWVIISNNLNVNEIWKIYLMEQKIYPNHQDEWYLFTVIYHAMSLYNSVN